MERLDIGLVACGWSVSFASSADGAQKFTSCVYCPYYWAPDAWRAVRGARRG